MGYFFVAIALGATVHLAVPHVDERKSLAPFFEEIAAESERRALYTTYHNDRRMALITYYLDRPVEVLDEDDMGPVLELLRGEERVGVILHRDIYEDNAGLFQSAPHRAHRATRGKDECVFLWNE